MATPYQGRHTGGSHRTPTDGRARTSPKRRALSRALRRPLTSAAAIVALAGATAAGYSSAAKPHASPASFTASPAAVAQATKLAHNRTETNAVVAQAPLSGVQRAATLTQQQQKAKAEAVAAAISRARQEAAARLSRARQEAAAALSRTRQEAAAALSRARQLAADRAAREQTRQSILSRAQSDPEAVARQLAADRGWESEQFGCLRSLWTKESGWRWNANNPSSGAYGIPQSLPGSKMASMGSDWATNPVTQIKWGLQYVSKSYGTPCSAWAHSQSTNWY